MAIEDLNSKINKLINRIHIFQKYTWNIQKNKKEHKKHFNNSKKQKICALTIM